MYDPGDTVHCGELPWVPLAPKVMIKIIKVVPETGAYSVIVKADEGGVLPRHRHLASAEIFILKGSGMHPQTGPYRAGDYVSEHEGALHEAVTFHEDTELLMISSGPSAFLGDDYEVRFMMDVPMLTEMMARAA